MKEKFFVETIVYGQCYADRNMEHKLFCEDCRTSECMMNPQNVELVEQDLLMVV